MAQYTNITIGSENIKVTQGGALYIAKALQLPQGVGSFRDMDMTDCLRMNGSDLEYFTSGQWRKVMSNYNGVYLTSDEIDIKIADALAGVSGDKNFIYDQSQSSKVWSIVHTLNKMCAVTVVDTAGTQVEGNVTINNGYLVEIHFNFPFSGTAILN